MVNEVMKLSHLVIRQCGSKLEERVLLCLPKDGCLQFGTILMQLLIEAVEWSKVLSVPTIP